MLSCNLTPRSTGRCLTLLLAPFIIRPSHLPAMHVFRQRRLTFSLGRFIKYRTTVLFQKQARCIVAGTRFLQEMALLPFHHHSLWLTGMIKAHHHFIAWLVGSNSESFPFGAARLSFLAHTIGARSKRGGCFHRVGGAGVLTRRSTRTLPHVAVYSFHRSSFSSPGKATSFGSAG